MYSIERTLLSTYIQYDLQLNDDLSSKIQAYELKEEDFKDQYFRMIIKTINHVRQLKKPYFMETLAEELQANGIFNEVRYVDVLTANIVTPNTFKTYYDLLSSKSKKSLHGDI